MHSKQLLRLYDGDRWFSTCRDYLLVMSIEEAYVLSFLTNLGSMREEDWFPCSVRKIKHNLKISQDVQNRIIGKLKGKAFIKVKMKGIPARRHFWIDYKFLDDSILEAMENETDLDEGEIAQNGHGPS